MAAVLACGDAACLSHRSAGARLRFTHWQVKHERAYVKRILGETTARLTPRG